jgi:hypothetical protein
MKPARWAVMPGAARQLGAGAVASIWKTCHSPHVAKRNNLQERKMAGPTIAELDQRIRAIRQNINDLVEQAAAYSGAGDESRAADRIAQQEQELRRLIAQRDALQKPR